MIISLKRSKCKKIIENYLKEINFFDIQKRVRCRLYGDQMNIKMILSIRCPKCKKIIKGYEELKENGYFDLEEHEDFVCKKCKSTADTKK